MPEPHQHDLGPRAVRTYLHLVQHLAEPATTYLDQTVTSWYFQITDAEPDSPGDDRGALVGFLAFRHRLSPWLLEQGGHIGYSVRPSRRREGHAGRALALAVRRAPELGIDRVLVTCDEGNVASVATIRTNDGVLEDVRAGKQRYWIAV